MRHLLRDLTRPGALAFLAALAVAGAARAQGADTVLDPLSVTIGPVTYRVAAATLLGSPLTRDEVARLLADGSGESLESRLRRVSAASVAIPEIVAEVRTADGVQTTVYRGIRLTDIVEGRIGSLAVDGGSMSGSAGDRAGAGRFGRIDVTGFDLPYVAALYSAAPAPAGSGLRPVYGSIALSDLQVTDVQGQVTRIARVGGKDFRARPVTGGWGASLAAMGETAVDATPASRRRVAAAIAEVFDAFAVGSAEASGISVGSGASEGGRIDRVSLMGAADGAPASLTVAGLDLGQDGSRVRLRSAEIAGTGGSAILRSLVALADTPPDAIGPGEVRDLVPPTGSLRLSGLTVEFPGPKGAAPERSRLGDFAFTLDKPVDGLPTAARLAVTDLDLPTRVPEGGIEQLAALGYDRLALDAAATVGWAETSRQIAVEDLSVAARGLGNFKLTATLGGATRDLFSRDTALATVALVGLSLRSVDLRLRDEGLAGRMIGREAAAKGVPAEEVRRNYGVAAAIGIPALIGATPAARAIGQAVARFVAKPGTLSITAKSKNPAGAGLADLGPAPDPGLALDLFDVTAVAE